MDTETIAQKALRLLSPIPDDQWHTGTYTNGVDKCCALGHVNRLTGEGDPNDFDHDNCFHSDMEFSLRGIARSFLLRMGYTKGSSGIFSVNDTVRVGIYNETTPKARVLHLLNDMIAAGY